MSSALPENLRDNDGKMGVLDGLRHPTPIYFSVISRQFLMNLLASNK
jgi:hypothetical protein